MNFNTVQFILQCFLPAILGAVFLLVFIAVDHTFQPKTLRRFLIALIFAILLLISESADYYLELQNPSPALRTWLVAVNYILRLTTIGLTVTISQRNRKIHIIVIHSLMLINDILALFSVFTHWYFSINADGQWIRGPLSLVPYIISYSMLLMLLITAFTQFRTNPGESVILISIIIFCVLSNVLEIKFGFRLFLPVTFIISIIAYFLSLNVQLYRRDTLTGLLNRRSFYMDTKRNMHLNMILVSMDLNDLKKYNDEEGHQAGDIALQTSVKNMQAAFKKTGTVYRTGGDEFIAVFIEKKLETVLDSIENFRSLMAETRFVVASGYAEYHPGDDFEKILSLSDKKMYDDKAHLKEGTGREIR